MTFEVIIITYNQEDLIKRSIESVINQTLKPSRVCIYDDCSNDNTIGVINEVIKNSEIPFSVYSHEVNQGIFKNIAVAFNNATQDIVCALAGDDEYDLNLLENLRNFIIRHNIDISKDIWVIPDVQIIQKNAKKKDLIQSNLNKYTPFEYVLAGRILSFEVGLSLSAAKKSVIRTGLGYQADLLKSLELIKVSEVYLANFIGYKYTVGVGVTNSTKLKSLSLSKIICLNLLILNLQDNLSKQELRQINYELAKACFLVNHSIINYLNVLSLSFKYLFINTGLYTTKQIIAVLLPSKIIKIYHSIRRNNHV